MPSEIKIAARFAQQCAVVYHNNYDTCGTITRSSIDYLTPTQLEALFTTAGGNWADLDAWFKTAMEMRSCGTRINGMYEWIMSGANRGGMKNLLTVQRRQRNPAVMFPFILGLQDSVINTEYWFISTGFAQSGYTGSVTGPLTTTQLARGVGTDRVLRIQSRYGVEMDEKWFRDRDALHVVGRSGLGVTQIGQWRVFESAEAADGSYVDVLVTGENAASTQPYDPAPTSGVVLIGVNNVNDFEKWCQNRPNYDGRKEVPFWIQTMRRARCVDQFYRETYARLQQSGVNAAFKAFGDIDLAARNRQDEENYQRHFVHSFFFNKALPNQTVGGWKSLADIVTPSGFSIDPGTGGKVVAKRANFKGVWEQLRECDRIRDLQNNKLNLYEFFDENYRLKRARASHGKEVTEIDWYTDSVMAANMITAYSEYLKREYGATNVQYPIDITKTMKNDLGFAWRTLVPKHPSGLNINIITHPFFDDFRDALNAEGKGSAGINLWAIDWSGIYWAQLASNRKIHTVGDIEKLASLDKDFACVMEGLTQEITLVSETGTVVVECPLDSTIITGIRDDVPDSSGKSSTGGGSYADLLTYG